MYKNGTGKTDGITIALVYSIFVGIERGGRKQLVLANTETSRGYGLGQGRTGTGGGLLCIEDRRAD